MYTYTNTNKPTILILVTAVTGSWGTGTNSRMFTSSNNMMVEHWNPYVSSISEEKLNPK